MNTISVPLSDQDVRKITNEYYSRFCCVNIAGLAPGVYFVPSPLREAKMEGYGCKFSIYALKKKDLCIIAYAPKYEAVLSPLKPLREPEAVLASIADLFPMTAHQLMEFQGETVSDFHNARLLTPEDYPLYKAFFLSCNPEAAPEGWLKSYFLKG